MANRKRSIILRCPVTAEERSLIEQKMVQLQTKRIGAYLRKMAIDGYIIYVDTRDIKEMNKLLFAIGRNINQIAKRIDLFFVVQTDTHVFLDDWQLKFDRL